MAKKSRIKRNNFVIATVEKQAETRADLVGKLKDRNIPTMDRLKASFALQKISRNGSKTRIRNRCVSCGRPRGVINYFGLCRLCIIKSASKGYLYGTRPSS